MPSFSGLGIGLSLVFGCLLLALVAELYYLLWWKKRVINREIIGHENYYSSNYAKEFFHLICWKRSNSSSLQPNNSSNSQERLRDYNEEHQESNCQDLELGTTTKDLVIRTFNSSDQESVEAELMRLHNLSGPPRFLFTIKEESKEDLESEDGKSRKAGSRTTSLSEILLTVDNTTPFLTPLASPIVKASTLDSYNNPLFESTMEAEMIQRLKSSPPPKFKFLRDAEEKLFRKLIQEAEKDTTHAKINIDDANGSIIEGSFLGFIVKNKDREVNNEYNGSNIFQQIPQYPSGSSQVLPLASSPSTTFRPILDKNLNVH